MVRLPNDKVNITWDQLRAVLSSSEDEYWILDLCERSHDINESMRETQDD